MPENIRQSNEMASRIVLASAAFLALVTPFGAEGTQAGVFILYRFGLIAIGAFCIWAAPRRPGPDFPARFYAGVTAFLGLMLLSVWLGSGWEPVGWTLWYQHVLFAFFFVGLARFASLQSLQWRERLLWAIVGGAVLHMVLPLSGLTGNLVIFVNRNYLGTYLLVGFACALALALRGSGNARRLAGGLLAALLLYGITATASRGATLAAAAVIVLGLVKFAPRRLAFPGAGLAIVVLTLGMWASPNLPRKFTDTGEIDPYNYDRAEIWSQTLAMIAEHPLSGVGPGQFAHEARRFSFPVDRAIGRYEKRINIAHSQYLQYAAESGLPVGLLLTGMILWFGLGLMRSGRTSAGPPEAAALLALTGAGLHALVDNVGTAPVVAILLTTLSLASPMLTAVRIWPAPESDRSLAPALAGLALLFIVSSLVPGAAYYANVTAQRYYAEGRVEEAAATQRLAVTLRPNDALMLSNLAVYYQDLFLREGDRQLLDRAVGYLRRAQEANPAFLPARQEYAHSILLRLSGDSALDLPIHRRLIAAFEAILTLDPYQPFVARNLAEAYYWTGEREKAARLLNDVLTLEPNYVGAYLRLAEWEDARGRTSEAGRLRAEAARVVDTYADQDRLSAYQAALLGRQTSQEARAW